jgi:N6-L-threonylcarbamoyladenine synthase
VLNRVQRALKETGFMRLGVSGGVAANGYLRRRLESLCREREVELLVPRPEYCTDNAAMIAAAGTERFRRFGPSPHDLPAFARLPLGA